MICLLISLGHPPWTILIETTSRMQCWTRRGNWYWNKSTPGQFVGQFTFVNFCPTDRRHLGTNGRLSSRSDSKGVPRNIVVYLSQDWYRVATSSIKVKTNRISESYLVSAMPWKKYFAVNLRINVMRPNGPTLPSYLKVVDQLSVTKTSLNWNSKENNPWLASQKVKNRLTAVAGWAFPAKNLPFDYGSISLETDKRKNGSKEEQPAFLPLIFPILVVVIAIPYLQKTSIGSCRNHSDNVQVNI